MNTESRAADGKPIVAAILSYLQDRKLQAGDRLPSERDLADKLGVGRNALREALATLTTLRIVESRPNSGIYLRHVAVESSFETLVMLADMGANPTPMEITETMEVRAQLELLAVKLACERRAEADLARMAAVLARTKELLRENGNMADADTEFHIALLEATHNSVLVRVLNAFYRFTAGRRKVLFANQDQSKASAKDHQKLFEYVKDRDVENAQALILKHMDRARNYWKNVLPPS